MNSMLGASQARQLLIILVCSAVIGNIFGQEHPEALSKKRYMQNLQNFKPSKAGSMLDVKHYNLELQVNPAVSAITGTVTTLFETKTATNTVSFDLRNNMTIDSIKYEGNLISTYTNNNHILSVTLPATVETGMLKTIAISYHGSPVNDGMESFTATTHYGVPVLWTLSEPYGAYTWWPCKQTLDDKADSIDVVITVPVGNKAASNGVLVSTIDLGNNQIRYHWKHLHSIATYLVAIAVTNYTELSSEVSVEGQAPIQIIDYAYPENASEWQSGQTTTRQAMEVYNNLFINYPFADEKYGHAQFGWGGGMEHQTMSFMYNLGEMLVAHELAHQWFGDYITCKGWDDIWINEGFATYCEGLYYENIYPEHTFTNWRASAITHIVSAPGGSVYVYDTTNINSIFDGRLSYDKGGMVLHLLRKQVGDEAFFAGIKTYLTDTALTNGFADTHDFRRHIEEAADTILTDFFNDWIFNQGYPQYQIVWEYENNRTEISVTNTPSHNSVSYFKLKIPVRFTNNENDTTVWLHNTYADQKYALSLGFAPTAAVFDPKSDLISRNNTVIEGQVDIDIDVSINENSEFVHIYPNPSGTGDIFVKSSKTIRQITISSITGKTAMTEKYPDIELNESQSVANIHLNSGIYILKIEFSDNTFQTEKIVIN